MSIVLAFIAVLLFALCAADALAGLLLRSQRFAEWFGWWSSTAEHDEWRAEMRRVQRKRLEPLP